MSGSIPHNQTLPVMNVTDVMLNPTTVTNQTVLTDPLADPGYGLLHPVLVIIWPVITSIGLVGNMFSFIVMTQLSKTSSFYLYLAVLALSDSAFLVFEGIFTWLRLSGFYNPFVNFAHGFCSAMSSSVLISSQFSSWIMVAVTIDRYIAVCHPFKVTKYCTKKRAIVCMGVVLVLLVGINLPMICFTWNDDYTQCISPGIAYDYCLTCITSIDAVCYILLPGFLIALFNILIAQGLYKASRLRRALANNQPTSGPTSANTNDSTRRTTVMLFGVTSVFIISLLPVVFDRHCYKYDH